MRGSAPPQTGGAAEAPATAPAFQGHKPTKREKMKTLFYFVKLGFSRITPKGLLSLGRTIVLMMTGNATFASVAAKVAALKTALDELEVADDAYDFNHGKLEREALMTSVVSVKDLIRELGGYVQGISAGDKDIITSAGFDYKAAPQPVGELPAPKLVEAFTTDYPGRVKVRWSGVKGRENYGLWICIADPTVEANWKLHTILGRNRCTVDGLTSLSTVYFRVVANGAAGPSPASMEASVLVR